MSSQAIAKIQTIFISMDPRLREDKPGFPQSLGMTKEKKDKEKNRKCERLQIKVTPHIYHSRESGNPDFLHKQKGWSGFPLSRE
ncbi:MAG: hypothetical protein AAB975_00010 [Patescibacteria group bacterium]